MLSHLKKIFGGHRSPQVRGAEQEERNAEDTEELERREVERTAQSLEKLSVSEMTTRSRIYDILDAAHFNMNHGHEIKVISRIGSPSVYGAAYRICLTRPGEGVCGTGLDLALKLQSVTAREYNDELHPELVALRTSNIMVRKGYCVNFPLFVKQFRFPGTTLNKERPPLSNLVPSESRQVIGMVNELANYDYYGWKDKHGANFEEGCKIFAQTFAGVYCINKLLGVYHNDMHGGNVLLNRLAEPKTFIYEYEMGTGRFVRITLNNCQHIAKIWDFGMLNTVQIAQNPDYGMDEREARRDPYGGVYASDFQRVVQGIVIPGKVALGIPKGFTSGLMEIILESWSPLEKGRHNYIRDETRGNVMFNLMTHLSKYTDSITVEQVSYSLALGSPRGKVISMIPKNIPRDVLATIDSFASIGIAGVPVAHITDHNTIKVSGVVKRGERKDVIPTHKLLKRDRRVLRKGIVIPHIDPRERPKIKGRANKPTYINMARARRADSFHKRRYGAAGGAGGYGSRQFRHSRSHSRRKRSRSHSRRKRSRSHSRRKRSRYVRMRK